MYSTATVANVSCGTIILFLKTTMAVASEETGQIELSDDDEAFAFGEHVIPEMMQDSSRHYEGCAIELYEGGRIVGRVPPANYRKPFSPWHLGLPHSE
jgi:hypothetical protein